MCTLISEKICGFTGKIQNQERLSYIKGKGVTLASRLIC